MIREKQENLSDQEFDDGSLNSQRRLGRVKSDEVVNFLKTNSISFEEPFTKPNKQVREIPNFVKQNYEKLSKSTSGTFLRQMK
jgi:hypothetical protein